MISRQKKTLYFLLMLLLLCGVVELVSLSGFALATGRWLSLSEVEAGRKRVLKGEAPQLIEAGDRGPVPSWEVLHPYLGFVLHPSTREDGSNDYGFVGKLPPFELGPMGESAPRDASRAVVAVVGGSVAQRMTYETAELLASELAKSECFAGRTVDVINLALPGVKQPQQLITLNYFLSIGAVLDVLISLDGFNEVALPIAENDAQGVFPFYPRNWKFYVGGLQDASVIRRVGEIEFWDQLRKSVAASFSYFPLRYSATANVFWVYLDRTLDRSIAMKKVDLALAQRREGVGSVGYMRRGPTRKYASEQAHYRDLVAVWERSVRLMHATSRGAGLASFHFLQPNQRVPGSKTFAPGERKVALPRRHNYDVPARKGYPGLIEAGKRLGAAGLPFDDLTMVFADVAETVYTDGCCHINGLGSRIMAREIARIIRARFAEGEPCPRFD